MITEYPYFPEPPRAINAGIDFLALGAVGERLIAFGLPGVTNVTRFLRPYSMASWVGWKFDQHMKAMDGQKLDVSPHVLFKGFREKVELAFSWANSGTIGSIGNGRTYPADSSPVEMRFDNPVFGAENKASWFAAAAYGPSFVAPDGLGFVAKSAGGYIPTELGTQMAEVLDAVLRSAAGNAYDRLSSLSPESISLHDIDALKSGLKLDARTGSEKSLFMNSLYRSNLVGSIDGTHGSRSTSLELMLRSLKAAGPLSEEAIRESIATGLTPDGEIIDFGDLERMRGLWFILSIRQLQRIALERLLRWFELALADCAGGWCDLRDVQDRVMAELTKASEILSPELRIDDLNRSIEDAIVAAGGLEAAMVQSEDLSIFKMRRLLESLSGDEHKTITCAVRALLHVACYVNMCSSIPVYADYCRLGGRERIGLTWFSSYVDRHSSETVGLFSRRLIAELIYAQHLRVAASRTEEGKSKFRFSMDERGLKLLIPRTSANSQLGTPDRIRTSLLLMNECELIGMDTAGRFFVQG